MKSSFLRMAGYGLLLAVASFTSLPAFACGPHKSNPAPRQGCVRPSSTPLAIGLTGGRTINSASTPEGLNADPGRGFFVGLQLRKKFCKGFSLESGLRYERTNYAIEGFTFSTGKGISAPMAMNVKYSSLEIPVLANIRLGGCCGLSYGLQVGGYGSKLLNYQTTMPGISESGETVNNRLSPDKTFSMGLTSGAYVELNMCHGSSLRLAPTFNYNLMNPFPVSAQNGSAYSVGFGATFFHKLGSCHRSMKSSCPARR